MERKGFVNAKAVFSTLFPEFLPYAPPFLV